MFPKLRYWSVYTIFRWQFILLVLAVVGIDQWLVYNVKRTGTDEWTRLSDWLGVLFLAMLILVAFSIVTLIIAWVVFRVRLKSGKIQVNIQLAGDRTPEAGVVTVEAVIKNILRPILGTVEVRILFPEYRISERILLDENKNTLLSPFNTISGKAELDLHHRGIHEIEEVQVVMTDMLKLLWLPVTMHSQNKLLTLPREMKEENFQIFPAATEEQDVRINIPKRVQGEFLSYKDFESGDDIRRIVWKIYARSGELVVRIPETRDPYASHVYIGMGFYNALISGFDDAAGLELLNIYKDYLRQVYEAVKRNQYSVRIIHDQEEKRNTEDDVSNDLFFISTAHWQNNNPPSRVFDTPKAAVVCLSSAVPAEEVENLIAKLPMQVPVVVFGLSSALGAPFRLTIKRIFFKEKQHPLADIRRSWWISPLRKKLKLNEDRIRTVVNQRGNAWMMQLNKHE
jgi:hypothetical protein